MDWLWLFVPATILAAFLVYYYFGGERQRMLSEFADDRHPTRRWAHGIFGLISGARDYAFAEKRDLRVGLRDWWGNNNKDGFRARFMELCDEQPRTKQEAAWCWVRAINLTRMAAGAGLVSHEACWRLIVPFLRRIQESFSGWEDLGQHYLAAYNAWVVDRNIDRQSVESVDDNINVLREGVWREMPFTQPLVLDDCPLPRPSRGRELLHMLGLAIDWGLKFRVALIILAFGVAAAVVLAQSFLSAAFAQRELIGTWMGELVEDGSIDSKKYDRRRWLMVVRPDQTGGQVMRWYLGRQRQEEAVEKFEWTLGFEWSVKDLVWRLTCKEISQGYACERKVYRISIDQGEMKYKSISGRAGHTMRKVSADYQLP